MAEKVTTFVVNATKHIEGSIEESRGIAKIRALYPENFCGGIDTCLAQMEPNVLMDTDNYLMTRGANGRVTAVFFDDEAGSRTIREKVTITGLDSFAEFTVIRTDADGKKEDLGIRRANSAGILETMFDVLPGSLAYLLEQ